MSDISSIASVTDQTNSFLNPAAPDIRTTGSKNLGVNDFLKLITVQLSNQDPLKPMEDTQFISQMASFTSLEQMQNLSKDVRQSSAQDYLGKNVTVSDGQAKVSGVVTQVTYNGTQCLLSINGNPYDSTSVVSVNSNSSPSTTPAQPVATGPNVPITTQ